MEPATEKLWRKQDTHEGDRWRLFTAIADAVETKRVFYPGSFVDISPSFVFPMVTYLDADKRTPRFFSDRDGIVEIINEHKGAPKSPDIHFIHGDYTKKLELPHDHFDLLVSLYSGFISEHCTQHLRIGGTLLVNPSHGDAAMASIDPRYEFNGVVVSRSGDYNVKTSNLDGYLILKKPVEITKEMLHSTGRGVAYSKPAIAYLFRRIE